MRIIPAVILEKCAKVMYTEELLKKQRQAITVLSTAKPEPVLFLVYSRWINGTEGLPKPATLVLQHKQKMSSIAGMFTENLIAKALYGQGS